MEKLIFVFVLCLKFSASFAQDTTLFVRQFENTSKYKLVIRTEEKINEKYIAVDNLTIKVEEDTTWAYYMSYNDGMVSSLIIPFSVYDTFLNFERTIHEKQCQNDECTNFILFQVGDLEQRYPIDMLLVESLSNLMFELEE